MQRIWWNKAYGTIRTCCTENFRLNIPMTAPQSSSATSRMRSRELDARRNQARECVGCLERVGNIVIHMRETYLLQYPRYLLNRFLCMKKGDNHHTSVSLSVRSVATLRSGSTKLNVDHVHRLTLSSGIERLFDGICRSIVYVRSIYAMKRPHIRWFCYIFRGPDSEQWICSCEPS